MFQAQIGLNRKLRISAFLAGTFLFLLLGLFVFPIVSYMDDTNAAVNLSNSTITISMDDLTLNFNVSSLDGTFAEDEANVSVATDNIAGYKLSIQTGNTGDDASKLVGEGKSFNTISAAISAADFSATNNVEYNGFWGYKPSKVNSIENTDYLPAPTEETMIEETDRPNLEANTYAISLGARADISYGAGAYENTFVITSVVNPIEPTSVVVDYDGNGLDFDNGNDTTRNTVRYRKEYVVQQESDEKYSHTPNIDDEGEKMGSYSDSYSMNEIVEIPGASRLHLRIIYGGESASFDWMSFWEGAYPSYTADANYDTGVKCDGNTTGKYGGGDHTDASNDIECDIDGNVVTFAFKSDGSGSGDGYGYYAVITGYDESDNIITKDVVLPNVTRLEGNYILPEADFEYRLLGWSISPNKDGVILTNEDEVKEYIGDNVFGNQNIVLYAIWQRKQTIVFDANGGNGLMEPQIIYGDGWLKENKYTYPELFFLGWNSEPDMTGVHYGPGTKYTVANDDSRTEVTLYAKWGACNDSASSISDAVCMQDMNNEVKTSMVDEEQYQLVDKRDGKSYYVSKLKSGDVWMTQNLDLELSYDKPLNPSDSDVTATFRPEANGVPLDTIYNAQLNAGEYFVDNNKAIERANRSTELNAIMVESGDPHYKTGTYYQNSTARAANKIKHDESVKSNGTICPKGWTLPSSTTGLTNNYDDLTVAPFYFGAFGTVDERKLSGEYSIPYGFLAIGSSDQKYNLLSKGFSHVEVDDEAVSTLVSVRCIASTKTNTPIKYVNLDGNGATSGNGETIEIGPGKSVLLPVEVFKKNNKYFMGWNTRIDGSGEGYEDGAKISASLNMNADETITLYAQWADGCNSSSNSINNAVCMQDINDAVVSTMSTGKQYRLVDMRDGKGYYITKTKSGDVWMTQNLDFDIDPSKTYTPVDTDIATNWNPTSGTVVCNNDRENQISCDNGDLFIYPEEYGSYGLDRSPAKVNQSGDYHMHYGNTYRYDAAKAEPVFSDRVKPLWRSDERLRYYANVSQSVCPAGWTLPNEKNLIKVLSDYGSDDYVGGLTYSPLYFAALSNKYNDESDQYEYDLKYAVHFNDFPEGMHSSTLRFGLDETRNVGYGMIDFYSSDYEYDFVRCVKRKKTTISFDGNGADGGYMEPQIFDDGTGDIIDVNLFTRNGYIFAGWNTEADGSGVIYENQSFYSGESVTLYAQWSSPINKTVRYIDNGIANEATYTCYVRNIHHVRYSYTPNLNNIGASSGQYSPNLNTNEVISIPGATSLHVLLRYKTYYEDWASLWSGAHPDYTAYNNYGDGIRLGDNTTGKYFGYGMYKYDYELKTEVERAEGDIEGDTVTFGFSSDNKTNYYGYYAVITADFPEMVCDSEPTVGSYVTPAIRENYQLVGWSSDENATNAEYTDESAVVNALKENVSNMVLYSVWRAVDSNSIDADSSSLSGEVYPARSLSRAFQLAYKAINKPMYIKDGNATEIPGWRPITNSDLPITDEGRIGFAMQDISLEYTENNETKNICEWAAASSADNTYINQIQVFDVRDGKEYWILKAADNKCWMTQNLDFDLSSSISLNSETTDLTTYNIYGYVDGYSRDSETGIIYWTPERSTIAENSISSLGFADGWSNDDNRPYSIDVGDWYWIGNWKNNGKSTWYLSNMNNYLDINNNGAGDKFSKTPYSGNGTHGHVGNYYNWSAAVASNDVSIYENYTSSYNKKDVDNSICPAGWRLPHIRGVQGTYTNEFNNLISAYGNIKQNDKVMTATPLWFVRSGIFYNGALYGSGYIESYWGDSYSPYRGNNFLFSSAGNDFAVGSSTYYWINNYSRWNGTSVRCVAR